MDCEAQVKIYQRERILVSGLEMLVIFDRVWSLSAAIVKICWKVN